MQARQLPARHGFLWFLAGLRLFRRNPPLLTVLTFSYLFAVVFLNLIPVVGPLLLPLALPSLALVVANGCRLIEEGRMPGRDALIDGFLPNRAGLLRLGGLHLAGSLFVLMASLLIEGGADGLPDLRELESPELFAMLARLLVIASPVLMAFWFAPLLTGWNGVPAVKAVFFSFVASLRNWRAFGMYGLVVALAGVALPGLLLIGAGAISQDLVNILSVALRMLLLFVLAPVLMASVYLSYRDVFAAPPPAPAEPQDAEPDA